MFSRDYWKPLLQSHAPLYYLCIIMFHFLSIIPYATPLDFNLCDLSDAQGDFSLSVSYISPEGLQLTPTDRNIATKQRAGRASYFKPLHLWDNVSGEMVDFNTTFSFVIDSNGSTNYADGLTFFLARNNSVITPGSTFGLPVGVTTYVATDPFVAVEFDTYWNDGTDPYNSTYVNQDHVGIDINSVISVSVEKWWSNIPSGAENVAWITYNANSQNLSVVFTGFRNNIRIKQYGLHHIVDLRRILPEWVIFGFTAGTGVSFQTNTIKSWSFSSSKLHVDESA